MHYALLLDHLTKVTRMTQTFGTSCRCNLGRPASTLPQQLLMVPV